MGGNAALSSTGHAHHRLQDTFIKEDPEWMDCTSNSGAQSGSRFSKGFRQATYAYEGNVADTNQQQPASQQLRIPTQQELQFHTQSIMQNALLCIKLQDQRMMLFEQAVEPAGANVASLSSPSAQTSSAVCRC
ncbi:hypothetical protein quinque_004291 [Culex quinquefasciatus]